MSKKTDKDDHVNVFSKGFTGGPLGLGDPNDKSLRHVEEHVFITQIIKDRAHHEKCHDLIKKWGQCMEDNNFGIKGLFSFKTCKGPLDEMNQCLAHYFKDKEFREECKQLYLERRTRYRETGILEKDPYNKKPYYESDRKKEYLEKFRASKRNEQSNEDHSQKDASQNS